MVCLQSHSSSFTRCSRHVVNSLCFHTPLSRRVTFVACDNWCLVVFVSTCERSAHDCLTKSTTSRTFKSHHHTNQLLPPPPTTTTSSSLDLAQPPNIHCTYDSFPLSHHTPHQTPRVILAPTSILGTPRTSRHLHTSYHHTTSRRRP